MLDANSSSEDADLRDLVSHLGLVDLHMNLHEAVPPKTYQRGRKKIDFIFGLHAISFAVKKGGILAYENGLKISDHRDCMSTYARMTYSLKLASRLQQISREAKASKTRNKWNSI